MAVIEESAGASAPAGSDLQTELLEIEAAPSPKIRRAGELARPCRCDHPIAVPDEMYPSWKRDLKCGRDVR
jgi:hypothetical protein